MLSSVLKSERAIEVNIAIMRTFVLMREMLMGVKDLYEDFRPDARNADGRERPRKTARRNGAEVRLPVPGCLRRDQEDDGSAGKGRKEDRI